MGIKLRQRDDPRQHIGDDDQSQGDGQVDQPKARRRDRAAKQADRQPDLVVFGHRQPAVGKGQHAEPFDHMGRGIAGHEQQQNIPYLQLGLAQLRGDAFAAPRYPQQHGALPPRQANRLSRPAVQPGIAGDHDLDDLDPFAIGAQAVFAVGVGDMQVQRAAKFVQRIGRRLKHQRVACAQGQVA